MFTRFFHAAIASVMLIAATFCHETAKAQVIIDSTTYTKVAGYQGVMKIYARDTATDTVQLHTLVCRYSSFTGAMVHITTDTTVIVHGTVVVSINVTTDDSVTSYGKAVKTLHGVTDTTMPPVLMRRMQTFSGYSVVRSDTTLMVTFTFDPGNVPATLTGIVSTSPSFTTFSPISTRTVTSLGPLVYRDTIRYLTPGTAYNEKYTATTMMGTITLIHADTTTVPLPSPTAHDSVVTHTSTTYNRRISCNVYGVTGGYAKSFVYDSATLALVDTQRFWLAATTGTQAPLFTHTGLTPLHGYISKVNVHDTAGDVWLIDTFRTTAVPIVPVTADSFWYLKTMGYNGIFTFRFTDTVAVTLRYRVEVNDSAFTGAPHYSSWDTITVTGHSTRTVSVSGGDTVVNWARVMWNKIGSTTVDTTTPVIMLRQHVLSVNVTPATTHLYPDLVLKPTNGRMTIVGTLGFDSSFTSIAPLHTFTVTTHPATMTIHDTVSYTLAPYTVYWLKYVVTDTFGTRTYIIRDTTLPLMTFPYVSDDGPSTTTSTSGTRPIKLDIYGSTGSYLQFFVDSMGVRVDSQYMALPAIVGVQTFSLTTIHRAPVHTYVWNVKVHNSVGDSWISTDSFTTDAAMSTLTYHNDTVKLIDHSTIHYVTGYTNYPGEMNDMVQLMQKVGTSVPVTVSTTSLWLPLGTVTTDFPVTTPGTYKLWSYGHDYSGVGHIAYSDTTIIVVNAPTIVTFNLSVDTAYIGDTVTASYYLHDIDSMSLSSSVDGLLTWGASDSGAFSFVADTSAAFTLNAFGITTVTSTKNLVVIPRPVDTTDTTTVIVVNVKNTENVIVFPNPAINVLHVRNVQINSTIQLYDMVGHLILSSAATSEDEKVNVANIPNGQYLLSIRNENNSTENLRFVIQR